MSYYKLVKDLVEKISKNSSSSTRFILLIFSTRYFNSNSYPSVQKKFLLFADFCESLKLFLARRYPSHFLFFYACQFLNDFCESFLLFMPSGIP